MRLRWLKRLRLRRWGLALAVVLCAAGGAIASAVAAAGSGSEGAVAAAGSGSEGAVAAAGSGSGGAISTARPSVFRADLATRLHAERLDYRWVVCVRTPHRFGGVRVVRCNVDFGIDPHVEAYCSVLRGGRLLTSEQDPAIPCGHDNAGFSDPVVTYR